MTEEKKEEHKDQPKRPPAFFRLSIEDQGAGIGMSMEKAGMSEIEIMGHLEFVKGTIMKELMEKTQTTKQKMPQMTLDGKEIVGDFGRKQGDEDKSKTLN